LKSAKYDIEIDDDDTVLDIKMKIQRELKLGVAEMMNLIHHGVVLQNEMRIAERGLRENDFIVLMLKKNRKKSKESSSESIQVSTTPTQAASTPPLPPEACTMSATTTADTPVPNSSSVRPVDEPSTSVEVNPNGVGNESNVLVIGDQCIDVTSNLMAMGFPEADVRLAMSAAFNNPERAVDYLLTGIPEVAAFQPRYQGVGASGSDGADSLDVPVSTSAVSSAPEAVRVLGADDAELARLLARNPLGVTELFQTVLRQHPEMFQRLSGPDGQLNPEAFNEAVQDPDFMRMMRDTLMHAEGDLQPNLEINQNQNSLLTADDEIVVERLEQMGFSRNHVLEAYVVCNKNEQMAANYLFETACEFSPLPLMNHGQQSPQDRDINAPIQIPVAERSSPLAVSDRNSENVAEVETTDTDSKSNFPNENE